jgi:HSP20 family molecular chaperone IbpA
MSAAKQPLVPRRDDFFHPFEQAFDKFFDGFFSEPSRDNIKGLIGFPKMNAYTTDAELVMHWAVSGMTAEDIKVEVTPDNVLVVSGKMNSEYQTPTDARTGWKHELRQSAFERRFQLPDTAEGDPYEAKLKDGILTLKWNLKREKELTTGNKQIAISSG